MIEDAAGNDQKKHSHKGRSQGFELAAAVVILSVGGFAADMDEDEHHGVGEKVRQRVDGIGHHGGTTAGEADAELQDGEEDIDQAAKKGNPVNFFFPRRNGMIRMLGHESIGTSGSLLCYRKGTKKY